MKRKLATFEAEKMKQDLIMEILNSIPKKSTLIQGNGEPP